MTKKIILSLEIFLIAFGLISCKLSPIPAVDDNELITTVKLNFAADGKTQTFIFSDLDGDGGNPPIKFDTIRLKANATYTMTIELYDESKTPIVNITDDVSANKDEHLFVYTPSPSSLLIYTYGDKDSRNLHVGLTGNVKTGAMAIGKLKVQLRHQPPINDKPSKDGTITPGSDDVNLDFNMAIQ